MSATKSTIVQLNQVGKTYQGFAALQGVNLNLAAGEVLGLFGHNGAGKTTLMKLILGLISADSGRVEVFGHDPSIRQGRQGKDNKQQIGFLPENVSFYEQLSGLEVLTYFARLKGYRKADALDLLAKVGLSDAQLRPVKTYSKGMRQRLGLAQAFIGQPKLLLLDEPTVGLDPIATSEFYQQVDELKSQGCAVILCSHVLPGVERHINRAMILSGGQVKAVGTLAELGEQAKLPVMIEARGLNGALAQDAQLQGFVVPHDLGQSGWLQVPAEQKLAVIKQLVNQPNLQDLYVQPPNLEQLYRYFLALEPSSSSDKEQ